MNLTTPSSATVPAEFVWTDAPPWQSSQNGFFLPCYFTKAANAATPAEKDASTARIQRQLARFDGKTREEFFRRIESRYLSRKPRRPAEIRDDWLAKLTPPQKKSLTCLLAADLELPLRLQLAEYFPGLSDSAARGLQDVISDETKEDAHHQKSKHLPDFLNALLPALPSRRASRNVRITPQHWLEAYARLKEGKIHGLIPTFRGWRGAWLYPGENGAPYFMDQFLLLSQLATDPGNRDRSLHLPLTRERLHFNLRDALAKTWIEALPLPFPLSAAKSEKILKQLQSIRKKAKEEGIQNFELHLVSEDVSAEFWDELRRGFDDFNVKIFFRASLREEASLVHEHLSFPWRLACRRLSRQKHPCETPETLLDKLHDRPELSSIVEKIRKRFPNFSQGQSLWELLSSSRAHWDWLTSSEREALQALDQILDGEMEEAVYNLFLLIVESDYPRATEILRQFAKLRRAHVGNLTHSLQSALLRARRHPKEDSLATWFSCGNRALKFLADSTEWIRVHLKTNTNPFGRMVPDLRIEYRDREILVRQETVDFNRYPWKRWDLLRQAESEAADLRHKTSTKSERTVQYYLSIEPDDEIAAALPPIFAGTRFQLYAVDPQGQELLLHRG